MKPVQLKPHQEEAVEKLGNGKILHGGTGVGKSITAIAYFVKKVCGGTYGDFGSMRTPKDIYVITTAKKRDSLDWEEEAHKFGIHASPNASVAGIKLTVDSWNNIGDYTDVENAFFVFDEQRSVGSGAWAQSLIKIAKRNEWIMLTATPGDTWLDYITVFVANGWYKNRTEFKRRHVVYNHYGKFPKVERYIEVGTLIKRRNQILVHMPYERHTVRHGKDIKVEYDKELFNKVVNDRWHVYENRPLRDVAELFNVMRKVVNSNTSRLEAVSTLIQKHPKLIVFYNFDYELEILRTLAPEESKDHHQLQETLGEDPFDETDYLLETDSDQAKDSTSSSGERLGKSTSQSSESKMRKLSSGNSDSLGGKLPAAIPSVHKQDIVVEGAPVSFEIAEWNGHKHEPIPKTDSWLYLVQYRAGAEGWNCVETDAMVFFSQTYSWKDHWQAHGRIDRMNTPFVNLYYYYFVSDSLIDKAIRKALRAKRSFNERDLSVWGLEVR
jgi:hypothetical protein